MNIDRNLLISRYSLNSPICPISSCKKSLSQGGMFCLQLIRSPLIRLLWNQTLARLKPTDNERPMKEYWNLYSSIQQTFILLLLIYHCHLRNVNFAHWKNIVFTKIVHIGQNVKPVMRHNSCYLNDLLDDGCTINKSSVFIMLPSSRYFIRVNNDKKLIVCI